MPYPYKKRGKMPRLENIYGLFRKTFTVYSQSWNKLHGLTKEQ